MTSGSDGSRRWRLLFVTARYPPHHQSAAEFRLRDIARGMAHRGHAVSVVCCTDEPGPEDDEGVQILRTLPHAAPDDTGILRASRSARRLRRAVRATGAELVVFSHLTGVSEAVLGVELPEGVRAACDVGSDWLRDLSLPHGGWFASWGTGAGARSGLDRFLAGTVLRTPLVPPPLPRGTTWFWSRRRWKACLAGGLPVHDATVLEPGIDLRGFRHRGAREPGDAVVLLFSEPIERPAGLHAVVLALGDLPPRVRLRVCGAVRDEGYLAEVAELGRAAGVMDRIEIGTPPAARDMPAAVADADVLVYARETPESFPRRVLEAFAVGTPVLASALTEMEDVIQPDRTCLGFPAGNVPELARQLQRLLAEPGLGATLGEAARRLVEREFALGYSLGQIESALSRTPA